MTLGFWLACRHGAEIVDDTEFNACTHVPQLVPGLEYHAGSMVVGALVAGLYPALGRAHLNVSKASSALQGSAAGSQQQISRRLRRHQGRARVLA